jgi:hypothetical protein
MVRLATSWVDLFAAYVAALMLGIEKFKEFTEGLYGLGLTSWSSIALIADFPLFALVFSIKLLRLKYNAQPDLAGLHNDSRFQQLIELHNV